MFILFPPLFLRHSSTFWSRLSSCNCSQKRGKTGTAHEQITIPVMHFPFQVCTDKPCFMITQSTILCPWNSPLIPITLLMILPLISWVSKCSIALAAHSFSCSYLVIITQHSGFTASSISTVLSPTCLLKNILQLLMLVLCLNLESDLI